MTWEPQSEPEFSWQGWSERSGFARGIARLRPDEGWVCIPLVVALCAIVGWSIADARWILSEDRYTSFLIDVAVLGALWGWISARLPIRRWVAHLLGAVVAAFVLSVMVGYAIDPQAANPRAAFDATAAAVTKAYLDLVWYRLLTTPQIGHFSLFLGILVWGTSQAASYDVFGHHRPVNAVLLLSVAFVANMSLTIRDQFAGLVIFSIAALALLLQTHAADERTAWVRHRIWRPRSTQTPHLRGGMAFGTFAVVAALVLTTMASSAPLADAWPTVAGNFRDFATWIVRYLPQGADTRISPGGNFSTEQIISTNWNPTDTLIYKIRTDERGTAYHWRVMTYDFFGKSGWVIGPQQKTSVGAGGQLEGGTQDAPTSAGRTQHTFQVTVVDKNTNQLVTPNEPLSADTNVNLATVGGGSKHVTYGTVSSQSYSVVALTPDFSSDSGMTENKLRVSGTDYPAGLKQMYTQGTEYLETNGPARQLLATIEATAPGGKGFTNAYDLAKAVQDYMRSGANFTYQTDITNIVNQQCRPQGLSWPDCFATIKTGFCEQYASTMTMLMRLAGVPARYVGGYLPGALDQNSPVYSVTLRDEHAWVEVYFPGYGWIEFDPTGSVGVTNTILPGAKVSAAPSASASASGAEATDPTRTKKPDTGTTTNTSQNSKDNGLPILPLSLVGIALVIAIVVTIRFRRITAPESPDVVYRGIARMAGWLGYKPQPTQTVYEYMGALGNVIPQTRPHLEAVASAKVEVTYGKRILGDQRMLALGVAQRRIRTALMKLAVRKPPIPFRRRRRRK